MWSHHLPLTWPISFLKLVSVFTYCRYPVLCTCVVAVKCIKYAVCYYDTMWCDTLIKINRDQREHSMNLKCIKMNLLSLRGVADRGFYFLCSNLDLKANTSNCKWQLLKLTSLQFISLFIFRFYNSDRARSARTSGRNFCSLSDWETAASSKVGNSGLTLFT